VNILVVEDSLPLVELVREELLGRGHEVTVASTLVAAREALAAGAFDALLCDYEFPASVGRPVDGLGVLLVKEVLAREPRPRVVLWSGLDRSRECAAAGVVPDRLLDKSDILAALDALTPA
jgi:CheY-like chemotaxis protein